MLMQTQANRFALQLLEARAEKRQITPLSEQGIDTLEDGYAVAHAVIRHRVAQGEVPVGRKIGFTNRTLWGKYGRHAAIVAPIWAPVFDSTVRYADNNHGLQALVPGLQPRIEPEIVFALRHAPPADATLDDIADCIDWIAHGIELVWSPYPDWKFEAADAVAGFGLHGALIIGEQHQLAPTMRRRLAGLLAESSVSLSVTGGEENLLLDAGFGSDVLDSPVHALLHLHRLLQAQPEAAPLKAGEIISTGTWTDAHPVRAGETCSTAFSGISIPGMTLSFV